MFTYKDAIDHCIAFLGADVSAQASFTARTALQAAYRNICNAHNWSFFYNRGRINCNAAQTTGTIAYDHTGGAYERMLTLTDATWPSWATLGNVIISGVNYPIAERISDTVVTLSVNSNPGADIASGTSYTLIRDTYELPCDCIKIDRMLNTNRLFWAYFVHPREWLERQQIYTGTAAPSLYCIMGDDNYINTLVVKFFPPPDSAYQYDFVYVRRARPLVIDEYSTGTVSGTAGQTTITGVGTAWASKHVGSLIRFGDSSHVPTGPSGLYPWVNERVIMSVESATSLTVDTALADTFAAGTKYIISDPVDLEEGAMLTAFQRGCEKEIATIKRMKDLPSITALYRSELREAMATDSRTIEKRSPYGLGYYRRLAHMPMGDDIT